MALEFLNDMYFGNTVYGYLIFFGIIVLAVLLGRIFYYISGKIIKKLASKTKTQFDDIFVDVIEEPLVLIIVVIGIHYAYQTLLLNDVWLNLFRNVIKMLTIVSIVWFIMRFLDALILAYLKPLSDRSKTDLDDHLVPIVRKLMKVVLVAIAIIMVLDTFGYNVTSIIAGLGIGGLAFALAAKDMLSNLFGGLSILMDKPFKLGDTVLIEGHKGMVEEIGLRTTKLRTTDKTQLIMPNNIVSNSFIENITREEARKVTMQLGLTYDTSPVKIKKAIKILEEIITKNSSTLEKSFVYFDSYGDFSLNIKVVYYIKEKDFDKIAKAKSDINMEILTQFNKEKLDFAFPTQTIHLEK